MAARSVSDRFEPSGDRLRSSTRFPGACLRRPSLHPDRRASRTIRAVGPAWGSLLSTDPFARPVESRLREIPSRENRAAVFWPARLDRPIAPARSRFRRGQAGVLVRPTRLRSARNPRTPRRTRSFDGVRCAPANAPIMRHADAAFVQIALTAAQRTAGVKKFWIDAPFVMRTIVARKEHDRPFVEPQGLEPVQ